MAEQISIKKPYSFRLSKEGERNLEELTRITNLNKTLVVEMALAVLAYNLSHADHPRPQDPQAPAA